MELDYPQTFGNVKSSCPGFLAIHGVSQLLLCVELFAEIQSAEIHFDFCLLFLLGLGNQLLPFGQLFAEIHSANFSVGELLRGLLGNELHHSLLQGSRFWVWCVAE